MDVPKPRGTLSEALLAALVNEGAAPRIERIEPSSHEDAQISLWTLYELHYRGFDGVDDLFEWSPELLTARKKLESEFEADLRSRYDGFEFTKPFADSFFEFVAGHDGASVSSYVKRSASRDQVMELLKFRSIYHLKESDPVAWVVPRLPVQPKASLMELQYDEYGGGNATKLHSHLFALGLEASGLDPAYGAYINDAPADVLELNNAMSLFGLHRRFRGAALGHLAAFEATSSLPSRKMSQGLARLGFPAQIVAYYDEHVEADAVHEQLAVRAICEPLIDDDPSLKDDVMFGAFTCLDLEDRFATRILKEWKDD